MDQLRHDVRFALRSIIRNPVVSLVAIISLALGIGANASIFSAVDVFMLKPLPFPDANRLVKLGETLPERGFTGVNTSMPTLIDWRRQSKTMNIAGYDDVGLNMSGGDQPERLTGLAVTYNFFDVLEVQPAIGRGFLAEEEQKGAGYVLIISHGLWQRTFGADPEILGRMIGLNGRQYTVVGVMPADFEFDNPFHEIWIPIEDPGEEWRATHYMEAFARVGSSVELARAELSQIQTRLGNAYPAQSGWGADVIPLREEWFDQSFRQGSAIAAVAVFFVLLIACSNVANLLLARGAARGREIALRGALGAGRRRIAIQLLTESVILATLGAIAGLLVAAIGIRGVVSLLPPFFPRLDDIALQPRTLVFMGGLTLLSAVGFGLLPSLRASRTNFGDALSEGGSGASRSTGGVLRNALVMGEIALATVLLISAALLVKSFAGLRSVDLGFEVEDLVTAAVTLPATKYPGTEDVATFHRELLSQITALPGVERAGAASGLPTRGLNQTGYSLPGRPAWDEGQEPRVFFRSVTPGFLETMAIPLLAGRGVEGGDVEGTPGIAVINERLAERHWAGESPLGQTIAFDETVLEIVGVVGNTRDWGASNLPPPMVYQSAYQVGDRRMSYAVKTSTDPSALIEDIRSRVRASDPEQPLYSVSTMKAVMQDSLGPDVAMMKVLGVLAIIAFILAAGGVYGVLAYSVAQRTREIGIRMALGAQPRDVMSMVVRQGSMLALVGVGLGLLASFVSTRGLAFFLVGVDPMDAQVFTAITLFLLFTGVVASYLPARRATRVDPMLALRPD